MISPKHLVPSFLRDLVAWKLSLRELRRLCATRDLASIVKASFNYRGYGVYRHIYALQKESEILRLARLVQSRTPKVIVEIGTAKGGTLFIWARSNPQLDHLVSIDLPGGNFGGGYEAKREALYRQFASDRPSTQMSLLRCDSHAQSTSDLLDRILGGRQIDFLWIDGDHTYEGVRRDFITYSAKVRPGGLIAFHDIITKGDGHEVHQLWDELKPKYRHDEFVEDPASNRMGIGVLHV